MLETHSKGVGWVLQPTGGAWQEAFYASSDLTEVPSGSRLNKESTALVSEQREYQTEIQAPKNKGLVTKHWCKSQVGPAAMLTELLKLSIMTGLVSEAQAGRIFPR